MSPGLLEPLPPDRPITPQGPRPAPHRIIESGETFVFREFERTRIQTIREDIAARPLRHALLYLGMVMFWTGLMSAGSALHGPDRMALNLTPHVALFVLIIGVFLFPLRMIWLPVLMFLPVFAYPFVQPFTHAQAWHLMPEAGPDVVLVLLGLNIGSGVVIGLAYRGLFSWFVRRERPYLVDLYVSLSSMAFFIVVCLGQLSLTLRFLTPDDPATLTALGIDAGFVMLATQRIVRGGVVVAAFLLATVSPPAREDLWRAILAAMTFVILGLAQRAGLYLHPTLDAVLLGILLVLFLPVEIGIFACITGVPLFAALTGVFLNDRFSPLMADRVLDHYGLVGLVVLVFIMALRTRTRQLNQLKDGSIRRLNRARDLAGVGLFAINLATNRFRLDEAGARIMSSAREGHLSELLARFEPSEGLDFRRALRLQPGARDGAVYTCLPRREGMAATRVLLYVWFEPSASGDPMVYGLSLDVTGEEDRKRRLTNALDELSRQQTFQRQLFSIVSHELRTPAAILSMLIDDLREKTGERRELTQMRDAADQLLSVMGDMRQAVDPEKNLPVERVVYVPAELAESVMSGVEVIARGKGHRLVLDLGAGAQVRRLGDARRLRQALSNLIRNAILHSGGTEVRLGYVCENPDAPVPTGVWTVEDNGIGIPPDQVERMFMPFERGAAQPGRRADGSGLGLYIARNAMELLGGSLEHYAVVPQGAGYCIRLPEPAVMPATGGPARAAGDGKGNARIGALRLLLIEDNALVGEVMKARLERIFARVDLVGSGMAAMATIAADPPDVVMTDLYMPELDGDTLIALLRKGGYQAPIIGITAAVVGQDMDRFVMAGASIVLQKPLDMAELTDFLNKAFAEGAATPPSQPPAAD